MGLLKWKKNLVKVGQIMIWPIWGCSQFSHNSQELFDTDFFFPDGMSGTVRTGFRSWLLFMDVEQEKKCQQQQKTE